MKMIELTQEESKQHFGEPVFGQISEIVDMLGLGCYVMGEYIRDTFLQHLSKNIDAIMVGSGVAMVEALSKRLERGTHVSVFKNFDMAQVKYHGTEMESVGTRKESYQRDSRKSIVEDGMLENDQSRRGFMINALAVYLNKGWFEELIDPLGGTDDLKEKVIRTPLDPDITFSDDPLRMIRCIRFVTQLSFYIDDDISEPFYCNRERTEIISRERIADELNKIMLSPVPSEGFTDLDRSGLLALIFPELVALQGVETWSGCAHEDDFYHTLGVPDNINKVTDNLWLCWATLLHDIAKPVIKHWEPKAEWTFHNRNLIGEKMIPNIFRRVKLSMNEKIKYVQKMVGLHMRPTVITDDVTTDSVVRRLPFEAGDDVDDLMTLCEADITSKNMKRKQRFPNNSQLVRRKLKSLEEKNRVHSPQSSVSGEEITEVFNLGPCRGVGSLESAIKDAILDGVIPNEYEAAYSFMFQKAKKMGLNPARNVDR